MAPTTVGEAPPARRAPGEGEGEGEADMELAPLDDDEGVGARTHPTAYVPAHAPAHAPAVDDRGRRKVKRAKRRARSGTVVDARRARAERAHPA